MYKWILTCLLVCVCVEVESSVAMRWEREGGELAFDVGARKTDFSIHLDKECFEGLSDKAKQRFKKTGQGYLFVYKQMPHQEGEYCLATRRVLTGVKPLLVGVAELVDWIEHKNVMFYTGAGISAAAGVPTMHKLAKLLPFDKKGIERAVNNPKQMVRNIRFFYRACYLGSPTRAHKSLKNIIMGRETALLTENLDQLHQRSGINPFCVTALAVKQEIGANRLKQVDAIICVGLSRDDKGLLSWYKELHPEGKIISIDLQQPSYLGENDFLLRGDIQQVIPQIEQLVLKKSII